VRERERERERCNFVDRYHRGLNAVDEMRLNEITEARERSIADTADHRSTCMAEFVELGAANIRENIILLSHVAACVMMADGMITGEEDDEDIAPRCRRAREYHCVNILYLRSQR